MRSKRSLIMLLLFALTIILSACNDKKTAILSMDEIQDLAHQGEALKTTMCWWVAEVLMQLLCI
ncbi:hypothetical protein BSK66_22400 [Paenibacillus odorifer]|uniref:Uncharacterized protein n=1 Tax=Paenibacillus odorifer TaxID=189426 RepID=A0A1R0WWX1_9BACL|nr:MULTISPECIES: hypothetical protein [Paenibacillus]ETT55785.1 hypothetical protein C171_19117 [Paenibacillus sp. FSL H8-237]OMD23317.1 hypothetical protein BJP51_30320 [Paenibacillus odorifer]OME51987.1 hypothetical protein BSK66_22400 [Paenibacillus odorifer]